MTTSNYRQITGPAGHLAMREAFSGSSMRAEWSLNRPLWGRLSEPEYQTMRLDWKDALDFPVPLYVVYSYDTPIAWTVQGKPAHIVDQRFSVTTSKQQGYVRAWINHYF